MKKFLLTYHWEVCIAVLTLVTNLVCFWLFVDARGGDVLATVRVDDGFYELTENLLAGNGFSWSSAEPYQPNSMRTPGYVWILALLIGLFGTTGTAFVQLFAATAIPLLGMAIAKLVTQSRTISIITGVILAIEPSLTKLSFQFYTETIFLIVFMSWLLLTLLYFKHQTLLLFTLSGVLLGYAILIKASVQYIPLLLIPCILWLHSKHHWRRSVLHISLFLLIIATTLTPWIIRNINTFDTAGLSTQSTFVLYTNFTPAVLSVAEGRNFLELRDEFLTPAEYRGDAITFQNQDEYKTQAIATILEHPTETIYIMARSVFTFFTSDGFYGIFAGTGRSLEDYPVFLHTMRLFWFMVTMTAFIGAGIYLFKKPTPQTVFIIILVAYFATISTVAAFGNNPRYRLPVTPIILAMAVIGTQATITRLHLSRLTATFSNLLSRAKNKIT